MKNSIRKIKSHKEVKSYISRLQTGSIDCQNEARDALIRSGVLRKNGMQKKVIVSWE